MLDSRRFPTQAKADICIALLVVVQGKLHAFVLVAVKFLLSNYCNKSLQYKASYKMWR